MIFLTVNNLDSRKEVDCDVAQVMKRFRNLLIVANIHTKFFLVLQREFDTGDYSILIKMLERNSLLNKNTSLWL